MLQNHEEDHAHLHSHLHACSSHSHSENCSSSHGHSHGEIEESECRSSSHSHANTPPDRASRSLFAALCELVRVAWSSFRSVLQLSERTPLLANSGVHSFTMAPVRQPWIPVMCIVVSVCGALGMWNAASQQQQDVGTVPTLTLLVAFVSLVHQAVAWWCQLRHFQMIAWIQAKRTLHRGTAAGAGAGRGGGSGLLEHSSLPPREDNDFDGVPYESWVTSRVSSCATTRASSSPQLDVPQLRRSTVVRFAACIMVLFVLLTTLSESLHHHVKHSHHSHSHHSHAVPAEPHVNGPPSPHRVADAAIRGEEGTAVGAPSGSASASLPTARTLLQQPASVGMEEEEEGERPGKGPSERGDDAAREEEVNDRSESQASDGDTGLEGGEEESSDLRSEDTVRFGSDDDRGNEREDDAAEGPVPESNRPDAHAAEGRGDAMIASAAMEQQTEDAPSQEGNEQQQQQEDISAPPPVGVELLAENPSTVGRDVVEGSSSSVADSSLKSDSGKDDDDVASSSSLLREEYSGGDETASSTLLSSFLWGLLCAASFFFTAMVFRADPSFVTRRRRPTSATKGRVSLSLSVTALARLWEARQLSPDRTLGSWLWGEVARPEGLVFRVLSSSALPGLVLLCTVLLSTIASPSAKYSVVVDALSALLLGARTFLVVLHEAVALTGVLVYAEAFESPLSRQVVSAVGCQCALPCVVDKSPRLTTTSMTRRIVCDTTSGAPSSAIVPQRSAHSVRQSLTQAYHELTLLSGVLALQQRQAWFLCTEWPPVLVCRVTLRCASSQHCSAAFPEAPPSLPTSLSPIFGTSTTTEAASSIHHHSRGNAKGVASPVDIASRARDVLRRVGGVMIPLVDISHEGGISSASSNSVLPPFLPPVGMGGGAIPAAFPAPPSYLAMMASSTSATHHLNHHQHHTLLPFPPPPRSAAAAAQEAVEDKGGWGANLESMRPEGRPVHPFLIGGGGSHEV